MLAAKRFKPLQLHVNNNSFTGPLVIGAFEKRVPGAQELVQPTDQYLFSLGSWKKIDFGHSSEKDNHPGFLPQQGFVLLYNLRRAGRYLAD